MKEFLRKIFSINNELTYICVNICGIKIKLRSNRLISVHKLDKNLHYLDNRLGELDEGCRYCYGVSDINNKFCKRAEQIEGVAK